MGEERWKERVGNTFLYTWRYGCFLSAISGSIIATMSNDFPREIRGSIPDEIPISIHGSLLGAILEALSGIIWDVIKEANWDGNGTLTGMLIRIHNSIEFQKETQIIPLKEPSHQQAPTLSKNDEKYTKSDSGS